MNAKEFVREIVTIADKNQATYMMNLHLQELDRMKQEKAEDDAIHKEHLENALINCYDLREGNRELEASRNRWRNWHYFIIAVAAFVVGWRVIG